MEKEIKESKQFGKYSMFWNKNTNESTKIIIYKTIVEKYTNVSCQNLENYETSKPLEPKLWKWNSDDAVVNLRYGTSYKVRQLKDRWVQLLQ